ncbi:ATPase component of various ABC-type transport systems with duplicated ATPase domain [Desulfosporosinus youngiae DSM 17734]|uniref:ATPase component of various ABC-type transport systems with duplicated ATPase domain n=2 Tax=Desulfosporosinus TaxID=79206 RepID=H5Y646_9FIRM|nr:ATP-binding cassette domain-containing protein [Desulfosporosinus youngiae]EHQ91056.1 ATPase component of various ABC-type transport systems with duplicated ATPase domain [Desulfosporosinus youngiae DSM 17734]
MDLILDVQGLEKRFAAKPKQTVAVAGVDFSIKRGECLGLIGESGSGKSTVAYMTGGLLPPSAGKVSFYGKHRQMVFQNPVMSFSPRMRLLDSIGEGLRYKTNLSGAEIKEKALEAMDMVLLKREYGNRYSWQLSGGECQRAAIARAILIRPELLICDEVTSALDVSVQEQIIQLLIKLKKELGLAYLFISHDIALVSSICDRLAVMYQGRIVETGSTREVIANPQKDYTKLLISSALTLADAAQQ